MGVDTPGDRLLAIERLGKGFTGKVEYWDGDKYTPMKPPILIWGRDGPGTEVTPEIVIPCDVPVVAPPLVPVVKHDILVGVWAIARYTLVSIGQLVWVVVILASIIILLLPR